MCKAHLTKTKQNETPPACERMMLPSELASYPGVIAVTHSGGVPPALVAVALRQAGEHARADASLVAAAAAAAAVVADIAVAVRVLPELDELVVRRSVLDVGPGAGWWSI